MNSSTGPAGLMVREALVSIWFQIEGSRWFGGERNFKFLNQVFGSKRFAVNMF